MRTMKEEELLRLSRKENKLFMLKIEKLDAELKEARQERDMAKKELKELWEALEDPEKCGELLSGM